MVALRSCKTELECIDSKTPQISTIKKSFGEDFIQAYIESWIVNLRMFFNVGRAMTDAQTFETAMMIVEEYPYLNIADINLIFKNAKLGKYGKLYDRLDGSIILEWFEKYFNDRCNAASERSIAEAESHKGWSYDSPERVREFMNSLMNEDKKYKKSYGK